MARKKVTFDLTPSPELMMSDGIGAQNMGLGFALAEIIANSLDWALLSPAEIDVLKDDAKKGVGNAQELIERLEDDYGSLKIVTSSEPPNVEIKTDFKNGTITILDQGVGMSPEELQVGIQLRSASDKVRAPLRMRKGQFGMGLNVAGLGLGKVLTIHTRSVKTPGETTVFVFDSEEMSGRQGWGGFEGYTTDESESDCPLSSSRGTAVVISSLIAKSHDDLSARELLCEIFHHAIAQGAKISFDGKPLKADIPQMNKDVLFIDFEDEKICPGGLWVKEDLGGGKRGKPLQIKGWVGLMEKTRSGDLHYGLHTFRRNQLIEMYHNLGTRANPKGLMPYTAPHAELARIFGHIHLDMVPPNFHKKGWNNDSPAWDEVRLAIKPILEPLVKLARVTTKDVKKNKALLGAYTRFVQTGEWTVPTKKITRKKKPEEDDDSGEDDEPPEVKTPFNFDGSDYLFLIPIQVLEHDNTKPPWDYIAGDASHEIQLRLFMKHPLFSKNWKDGTEVLNKFAKIDVFCQMLSDRGQSSAMVQAKKEELYRELF